MIVPLPKKGDLSDCSNWRGIALLSIPGKIMASIMLNRMKEAMDNIFFDRNRQVFAKVAHVVIKSLHYAKSLKKYRHRTDLFTLVL